MLFRSASNGTGWSANRALLLEAAKMSGVDPRALITTVAVESSFNPNAAPKNPNLPSSAKGFGQHLDDSWQEDLQRDGKKYGIPNGTTQFDPRASALMTASRLKFNGKQLQKNLGRAPTTTDLYLAHLMGLSGGTNFLKAPEDAIGSEIAAAAAKQHPEYFYKGGKALTVKEVYAGFAAKISQKASEFGVTDADLASTAPSTVTPPASTSQPAAAPTAPVAGGGKAVPQSPNAPLSKAAAAAVQGAAAPATAPAAPVIAKASFNNTPSAGSTSLSPPIQMEKGKAAVMGTGVPMVLAKGAVYELILQREDSEEDGVYGTLRFPDGTSLNTLELPWRDNLPRMSCIPPGTYPCSMRKSATFGEAYEVGKVPGRSAVLIHAGNSAGSADKGMKADSQGCILLGMDRGRKGNQKVITASKAAMKLFQEKMGGNPFTLVVRGGKNATPSADNRSTMSFDPVRKPIINATVAPKQEDTPAVTVQQPKFTPQSPRSSASTAQAAATTDLPRLSTTNTSMNLRGPSKEDMRGRDEAMSAVIAPRLEGIATILTDSLGIQKQSRDALLKILEAFEKKEGTAPQSTPTPQGSASKVKPMSSTDVPIPQRRNV